MSVSLRIALNSAYCFSRKMFDDLYNPIVSQQCMEVGVLGHPGRAVQNPVVQVCRHDTEPVQTHLPLITDSIASETQ